MRNLVCFFVLMVYFSCKNKNGAELSPQKEMISESEEILESKETETIDYSNVIKDTLIVSGKEIVFLMPSKEELKAMGKRRDISKLDSTFKYNSARVKEFLKFPEDIKISYSTKRIIGVNYGNRIKYYDKLDYFKCNFGMLMMFNISFNMVKGVKTDEDYFSLIVEYYRENIRLEKTIAYKYVIAKNGLNVREAGGEISDKYDYGEFVEIIGYSNDTIEVNDNGKIIKDVWASVKWKRNGWTYKRYVFNGFLGDREDIIVFKDQICLGYYYSQPTLYSNNADAQFDCLTKYFDFELISEKHFNAIKPIHETFLKKNPLVKIEENEDKSQNIILPIKDSTIVFSSKIDYSGSSHSYYGDVDFLNQYLTSHIYYKAEEGNYSYIDRTSGKETFVFADFPFISPDKKYIICFFYDVYDEVFSLEKYDINENREISFKNGFAFEYWVKPSSKNLKWISKNEFAIEITNKKIWNGSADYKSQYLKIKLKH
ncbi:hypothetical protein [Winogradskyella helgolandensis]|uniref:hypothetical protein n=1 Tax=Winogradskyella helgolandensis TaxID=2697010 RepID=UPI0015CA3601|nr:hypothetical protein [Winogradskyella helgolandensis]